MMMNIWLEGRTHLQGSVGYRHWIALNMFHHLSNANFQRLYWPRYLQLLGTGMLQLHLQSDFYVFTQIAQVQWRSSIPLCFLILTFQQKESTLMESGLFYSSNAQPIHIEVTFLIHEIVILFSLSSWGGGLIKLLSYSQQHSSGTNVTEIFIHKFPSPLRSPSVKTFKNITERFAIFITSAPTSHATTKQYPQNTHFFLITKGCSFRVIQLKLEFTCTMFSEF